jgi:hypothetical protein
LTAAGDGGAWLESSAPTFLSTAECLVARMAPPNFPSRTLNMLTSIPVLARQRIDSMREAFRHRRLADQQARLWAFYMEHNLFDQAVSSRRALIDHLRAACEEWRRTLATIADAAVADD